MDTTGRHLLVHDGAFAVLGDFGEITGTRGAAPDGLFCRDARHLSRWHLTVDGAPLQVLVAAGQPGPDRPLRAVLTPVADRDEPPPCTVFREQAVLDRSLLERIRLVAGGPVPTTAVIELTVDADFADQFELRSERVTYDKPGAERTAETLSDGAAFDYRRQAADGGPEWHARTVVTASPAPDAVAEAPGAGTARTLRWRVPLAPHGSAVILLRASALPSGDGTAPSHRPLMTPADAMAQVAHERRTFTQPPAAFSPGDLTTWDELARACEQGLADLAALRVPATGPDGEALRVPAAGIPWFLTLFGRDSLLTSLFALPYQPEPAAATLLALAANQGRVHDPDRLEQPGRIVHEVRHGELSRFRQVPYGRYYGTVDATPLFLTLLHAHAELTADEGLARRLEPQARAAVEWMFRDGGLNEHGWLVYSSDAEQGGLVNQNWKDSPGAVCFRDGTPAQGPIAVAEAQGYAYDALLRTARLAREVWDDASFADRLEKAAQELRSRFHEEFWMPDAGFPALALDGLGRQVDALASDAGHLLWSGILHREAGRAVGRRLLEPDFFSGWGIRTLAAGQAPYHPLSYHRGSIWPHDNAVIVLGLARYGLPEEALTVARGLVEAAALHDWRLPEVLAGYGRDDHPAPVPYPHSCSPQAWAAATPLALLTALRG
ncbi:glycogen debranching N-terminal domain-containing protein [Streptomyces sp. V3I7]|uniref:amylo-alpha-1,6-glucosidase n=1 Tax=Streptomyces sp. V3I7 TaxID=3042278 RepID=UPI0027807445|nr:glycogen debranching N-terminal domain-containing protein [Streptomyces sp. V3I7]MDQ0989181.1 glycogen debranching enzyme [Streptomyces sp. V3I7]